MAVRINGQDGDDFRKRQVRHNSAQGFRNGAPYDSRSGGDSPLWPTVNIKIGMTDEEIEPDGFGVVTVWRNPTNGVEAKETNEKIRVYLDWMHDDQSIPENTEVLCIEFPDEKLWRVFIDQDPAAVELERCSDKKTVLAYDIKLDDQRGLLSDNIGSVVRLRDSAFFETDCWTIKQKSDCIPEICPDVCLVTPDCRTCYGCYKLTQCVDPSIVKITTPQNICEEHQKGSGNFFDLIAREGGVILLDDGFCYTVEIAETCAGAEDVKLIGLAEDCQSCLDCYRLELCPPDPNFPQSFPDDTVYIYKDDHKLSEGDVIKYEGRCYKVFDGFNNCPETAIHVNNSFEKYDDCEDCADSGCYDFISCSEGLYGSIKVRSATILDDDTGTYLDVDLDPYVGSTVMTADGNCYAVVKSFDECELASDVIILEVFEDCNTCGVWRMEGCYGAPDIYTYDDMTYYAEKGIPYVLRRAEDDLCYKLKEFVQNQGFVGVTFTVLSQYPDGNCSDCEKPIYLLTPNCDDCSEIIGDSDCSSVNGTKKAGGGTEQVTDEFLLAYVGQYIKIDGICYYVSDTSNQDVTLPAPLTFTGGFPSCEVCQKTCLWVVTDVYKDSSGDIRQKRAQIIVDQICREDDELVYEVEDCP